MYKFILILAFSSFVISCSNSQDAIGHRQELIYKLEDQSPFIEMQIPLFLEQVNKITDSIKNRDEASRAVFWKVSCNSIFQHYLERTNSEYAFVDLWVFSIQLEHFFESGNGVGYFNQSQNQVVELSHKLHKLIDERASLALTPEDYLMVKAFVEKESLQNNIENIMLIRPSIKDTWLEQLNLKEQINQLPKMKLPIAVSNASERINAQLYRTDKKTNAPSNNTQTENPLLDEFRRTILLDSIRSKVNFFLAARNGLANDRAALTKELEPYISVLQSRLQADADRQEGFIVHNVSQIITRITNSFWTNVNSTINRFILLICGACIVIISLPFFLGWWFGRIYQKNK